MSCEPLSGGGHNKAAWEGGLGGEEDTAEIVWSKWKAAETVQLAVEVQ